MTECIYYVFQWLHSTDIIRHNPKFSSCISKKIQVKFTESFADSVAWHVCISATKSIVR